MNNRRKLVIALGAGALAAPLGVIAQQQGKVWRLGFLSSESLARFKDRVEVFRSSLRELGYVEDKNLVIDFRWADGKSDRLPGLAGELVRLKVDMIVTHGIAPLRAAMNATKLIPIVTAASGDIVVEGLVTSLARPGGNITGEVFFVNELAAKRVELLKDALPRLAQVAVLQSVESSTLAIEAMEIAARTSKLTLHKFPVRSAGEFEAAFAGMVKKRVGAVAIPDTPMFISNPKALAELAAKHRLPSIGPVDFALAGGLLSYGVDFPGMWRRAGSFVDKIFKGAKPADIPIEQATRFELIVNMKIAKTLGIKVPNSVLVRATKVIE